MGTDKATVVVGGRILLDRVGSALASLCPLETLLIGGPARANIGFAHRHVPDAWPGEGPLGGIVTALRVSTTDLVLVVPCDLPDLEHASETVLSPLLAMLSGDPDLDVVVPVVAGRPQLAVAAYRSRSNVVLAGAFESGARSLRDGLRSLCVGELVVAAGDQRSLVDLDTANDLAAWSGTPARRDAVQ